MKASFSCRIVILAGLAIFLTACSHDPNVRKQKYFESGQRYFAKGKYREAVIQFRNATDVDSTFAAAHFQLGETYLKLQDWPHAYSELNRTLELDPENYKAHKDIATLLIASVQPGDLKSGDLKMAQEQVELLLQKQPNDSETHIIAGNLLAREGRLNDGIAEIQKAISLAPNSGDAYLDLATLQARGNLPQLAEANFKKAIALKATAVNPNMALAAFYQSQRRYPEAEQQVQQVIASDPNDTDSRASLAKLYMAQGKRAEAEDFLKQVKQQLPDNPAAYRMLGDFYFAIGDLDKAVAEYESLYHDHAKDPEVDKNYIQLLILKNRIDDAAKLDDQILKSRPQDPEALTFRGEIQMARGKANDAVQTLQGVISKDPNLAVAHFQLGLALNQSGNLDRAGAEWREAARLDPNMSDAHRELARFADYKGDMSAMEQEAAEIIRLQPGSPDGYTLRSFSLMARKQFPAAEQDARKAVEVAPQAAAGYVQVGNVFTMQQKFSEAESWYRQALSRDPNSTEALSGLMKIDIDQKQLDKAIEAVNNQIAISPDNSNFYNLKGATLVQKKDYAGATTALKKAVDLNKKNADAYLNLSRAQAGSGALDDAIATCNAALHENPSQSAFYLLLGSLYEKKHNLDEAKSAYESALRIKPDDPLISNNLAYVLLETNSNPDMALNLAQTARRGLPQSSNAADTLGWAFYQKALYPSAIGMFQEAIKLAAKNKEPDSATYHYHLGLAYQADKQPLLAKQHFEKVLKIDPNYADAADVRKQLAQLRS